MGIIRKEIIILCLVLNAIQINQITNGNPIKSDQLIGTLEPEIIIPVSIYSGEIIEITGIWEALDKSNVMSNSEINVSLYDNSELLKLESFVTRSGGDFVISFDYGDLGAGFYLLQIEFSKDGYQGWVIDHQIRILHSSYTVQIHSAPQLIPGEIYIFTVRVTYDNEGANNDGQAVADVELEFKIGLMYEDGREIQITKIVTTNLAGIGIIVLSPTETQDLEEIVSVSVEVPEGPGNNPVIVSLPSNGYPVIVTIVKNETSISSLEFSDGKLIFVLTGFVIIFTSLAGLLFIKRRRLVVDNNVMHDDP